VLSSLLFQGQLPGEFLVPEEQWPLVDSLINRPDVRTAIARGNRAAVGLPSPSRVAPGPIGRSTRWNPGDYYRRKELVKAAARRDPVTNQSVVTFQLQPSWSPEVLG